MDFLRIPTDVDKRIFRYEFSKEAFDTLKEEYLQNPQNKINP